MITIDKIDKKINITCGNFRESFLADIITNRKEYWIPYYFNLFKELNNYTNHYREMEQKNRHLSGIDKDYDNKDRYIKRQAFACQ